MEAEFACDGARADEVRPAEGGEEIVERFFVGHVNDGDAGAPSESITMKQVVVANGNVEEIARCDARRILVVILRAIGWNLDTRGACSGRSRTAARGVIA